MMQKPIITSVIMSAIMAGLLLPGGAAAVATEPENGSTLADTSLVQPANREKVLQISRRIDELVMNQLARREDQLNNPASDEVFVRRVYLDIIGRIPSMDETTQFLNSSDENKRARLIDELLNSYGYVSHQFNFLADLLRVKTKLRNLSGQPYVDFLKDALEENTPYDDLVRELLQAEGEYYERGNGSAGYYLRDVGMPEDNMSNTIRIFLGTRLECAQCHDHPFDKWTQRQYFEMVAFTGGLSYRTRKPESESARDLYKLRRSDKVSAELRPILRRIIEPMTYNLQGTGTGLARLPEGFMGDDGDEFEIVKAKTMFEGESLVDPTIPTSRSSKRVNKKKLQQINGAREIDSRTAYAEWLTSHDNPRFAKVIANRLWKKAFGLGLIEPVDTIEDNTVASNPELMDYLTETMIELDFDMKQFLRAIYNSKTYQVDATGEDITEPQKYNFNGPVLRRMSAEQIWDSLLTISLPEIDVRDYGSGSLRGYGRGMMKGDIYDNYEELTKMSADELVERAEMIQSFRKGGQMAMEMRSEYMREARQERAEVKSKSREFQRQLRQARRNRDEERIRELMIMKNEFMAEYQRNKRGSNLKRASELSSPAPAGHFLREFGQSDREEIENANDDPAVTQVLSLMNGFIETKVAKNENTLLMKNVLSASDDKKIDSVYLTMLNRRPTRAERKTWTREFLKARNKKEVLPDFIWVLANSNEFIFVR